MAASTRKIKEKKSHDDAPKMVYLIRHGQSQGQTAKRDGRDRKRDPSLVDCGLTKLGIQQASRISSSAWNTTSMDTVELVLSSPLTRALQTAILGFPNHTNILVHYGLRELGTSIPENRPRGDTHEVMKYIYKKHRLDPVVDTESLKPPRWPQDDANRAASSTTTRIQEIFRSMARERTEDTIAVVCHYHVIRAALAKFDIRPRNAVPIACHLHSDGRLVPIVEAEEQCLPG